MMNGMYMYKCENACHNDDVYTVCTHTCTIRMDLLSTAVLGNEAEGLAMGAVCTAIGHVEERHVL